MGMKVGLLVARIDYVSEQKSISGLHREEGLGRQNTRIRDFAI
jgi:hypothetical protein